MKPYVEEVRASASLSIAVSDQQLERWGVTAKAGCGEAEEEDPFLFPFLNEGGGTFTRAAVRARCQTNITPASFDTMAWWPWLYFPRLCARSGLRTSSLQGPE